MAYRVSHSPYTQLHSSYPTRSWCDWAAFHSHKAGGGCGGPKKYLWALGCGGIPEIRGKCIELHLIIMMGTRSQNEPSRTL